MARLTILTSKELEAIYGLPQFTDEEREIYFELNPIEKQMMDECRTYAAKIYFILQLGYFKAKKQFFVFDLQTETIAEDVWYMLRRYFPQITEVENPIISKPTRLAQQDEILKLLDYQLCSQEWKKKLQKQSQYFVTIYTKPVYIFKELANFLEHHRVILPGYTFMQEAVIGKAMTLEQNRLEKAVQEDIPEEQRKQLDN